MVRVLLRAVLVALAFGQAAGAEASADGATPDALTASVDDVAQRVRAEQKADDEETMGMVQHLNALRRAIAHPGANGTVVADEGSQQADLWQVMTSLQNDAAEIGRLGLESEMIQRRMQSVEANCSTAALHYDLRHQSRSRHLETVASLAEAVKRNFATASFLQELQALGLVVPEELSGKVSLITNGIFLQTGLAQSPLREERSDVQRAPVRRGRHEGRAPGRGLFLTSVGDGCADDPAFTSLFGDCSTYRAGGHNDGFCEHDRVEVHCPVACGTCSSAAVRFYHNFNCSDSPTFDAGHGDCSSYRAGHPNSGFCIDDGAAAHCPMACGLCRVPSHVRPVPHPNDLPASCAHACGDTGDRGGCFCDAECVAADDCCPDYAAECAPSSCAADCHQSYPYAATRQACVAGCGLPAHHEHVCTALCSSTYDSASARDVACQHGCVFEVRRNQTQQGPPGSPGVGAGGVPPPNNVEAVVDIGVTASDGMLALVGRLMHDACAVLVDEALDSVNVTCAAHSPAANAVQCVALVHPSSSQGAAGVVARIEEAMYASTNNGTTLVEILHRLAVRAEYAADAAGAAARRAKKSNTSAVAAAAAVGEAADAVTLAAADVGIVSVRVIGACPFDGAAAPCTDPLCAPFHQNTGTPPEVAQKEHYALSCAATTCSYCLESFPAGATLPNGTATARPTPCTLIWGECQRFLLALRTDTARGYHGSLTFPEAEFSTPSTVLLEPAVRDALAHFARVAPELIVVHANRSATLAAPAAAGLSLVEVPEPAPATDVSFALPLDVAAQALNEAMLDGSFAARLVERGGIASAGQVRVQQLAALSAPSIVPGAVRRFLQPAHLPTDPVLLTDVEMRRALVLLVQNELQAANTSVAAIEAERAMAAAQCATDLHRMGAEVADKAAAVPVLREQAATATRQMRAAFAQTLRARALAIQRDAEDRRSMREQLLAETAAYHGVVADVALMFSRGCLDNCNAHGGCRAGECECSDGRAGATCDAPYKCPLDCTSPAHGRCLPPPSAGAVGTCQCAAGWAGADCATPRCADDCNGHGTCLVGGGNCSCIEGYQGPACAAFVCEAGCAPPHGACVGPNLCQCGEGRFGRSCQHTVDCGEPAPVAHGSAAGSGTQPGAARLFSCDAGHQLADAAAASTTCQPDGSWSGPPAQCVPVACAPPALPAGAGAPDRVVCQGHAAGQTCEYHCPVHMPVPHGDAVVSCTAGREWSAGPPTCIAAECAVPDSQGLGVDLEALHLRVQCTGLEVGSLCAAACDFGFDLQPPDAGLACRPPVAAPAPGHGDGRLVARAAGGNGTVVGRGSWRWYAGAGGAASPLQGPPSCTPRKCGQAPPVAGAAKPVCTRPLPNPLPNPIGQPAHAPPAVPVEALDEAASAAVVVSTTGTDVGEVVVRGVWKRMTSVGGSDAGADATADVAANAAYGGSYLLDDGRSDPDHPKSVTFRPRHLPPRIMPVYVRYVSGAGHAAAARVTIAHDEGTAEVLLDQRGRGGRWLHLGTFPFGGGVRGSGVVELTADGNSGGPVSADSVMWLTDLAAAPGMLLRADAYQKTSAVAAMGEWSVSGACPWEEAPEGGRDGRSVGGSGQESSRCRPPFWTPFLHSVNTAVYEHDPANHIGGEGAARVVFNPTLRAEGKYVVGLRLPAELPFPIASRVAARVTHQGGLNETAVELDLTKAVGRWLVVGTFEKTSGLGGIQLELSAEGADSIIAVDEVMYALVDPSLGESPVCAATCRGCDTDCDAADACVRSASMDGQARALFGTRGDGHTGKGVVHLTRTPVTVAEQPRAKELLAPTGAAGAVSWSVDMGCTGCVGAGTYQLTVRMKSVTDDCEERRLGAIEVVLAVNGARVPVYGGLAALTPQCATGAGQAQWAELAGTAVLLPGLNTVSLTASLGALGPVSPPDGTAVHIDSLRVSHLSGEPVAVASCESERPVALGASPNAYEPGTQCEYACNPGYESSGTTRSVCHFTGIWDQHPGACHRVDCGSPPPLAGATGVAKCTGTQYGDSCSYVCGRADAGLRNRGVMQCGERGEWKLVNGSLVGCDFVGCGRPPVPHAAHAKCSYDRPDGMPGDSGDPALDDAKRVTSCDIECDAHYAFPAEPAPSLQCSPTGKWLGARQPCVAVDRCGLPPSHPTFIPTNRSELLPNLRCTADALKNGLVTRCAVWCPSGSILTSTGTLSRESVCDGRTAGATWTGAGMDEHMLEACVPVKCPPPPAAPAHHGVRRCSGDDHGAACFYSCGHGLRLTGGVEQRECRNGGWVTVGLAEEGHGDVDGAGICTPVKCPAPPPPPEGAAQECNCTHVGCVCTTTCPPYTVLSGEGTRRCDESGAWAGAPPACEPLACPAPPAIPHGSLAVAALPGLPPRAHASCEEGYVLHGAATRDCVAPGAWEGATPSCAPVTCVPPTRPRNGRVTCPSAADGQQPSTRYVFGDRCETACYPGYRLVGAAERACREDGAWSGALPHCVAMDCPHPPTPANGSVLCSGLGSPFGGCLFACDDGFDLHGPEHVSCRADSAGGVGGGAWSAPLPTCAPANCGLVPTPPHGRLECSGTSLGHTCRLVCNVGFAAPAGELVSSCREDGRWDRRELPPCEPAPCGEPQGTPANAAWWAARPVFGHAATPVCKPGHGDVSGRGGAAAGVGPARVCTANNPSISSPGRPAAAWADAAAADAAAHACAPVGCGPAPAVAVGDVQCTGTTYGQTCTVACPPGQRHVGVARRPVAGDVGALPTFSCGHDGVWRANFDTSAGVCEPALCSAPPTFTHPRGDIPAQSDYAPLESAEQVAVACFAGGGPAGTAAASGNRTGNRTGVRTDNSNLTRGVYGVGAECTYDCVGQPALVCGPLGTWEGNVSTCGAFRSNGCAGQHLDLHVVTKCAGPRYTPAWLSYANQSAQPSAYPPGTTCRVSCDDPAHHVVGASQIGCTDAGAWDNPMSTCRPIPPPTPPTVAHGQVVCAGAAAASCRLQCARGFVVPGGNRTERVLWSPPAEPGSQAGWRSATRRPSGALACEPVECAGSPSAQEAGGSSSEPAAAGGLAWDCSGSSFGDVCYAVCEGVRTLAVPTGELALACSWNGRWERAEGGGGGGGGGGVGVELDGLCAPTRCGPVSAAAGNTTKAAAAAAIRGARCSPADPANATDGWAVGTVCEAVCESGHLPVPAAGRTCLSNGQWSERPLRCRPVDCGMPVAGDGERVTCLAGTLAGAVCDHRCVGNHTLAGSARRRCDAQTGRWVSEPDASAPPPACVPVSCPAVHAPPMTTHDLPWPAEAAGGARSLVRFDCNGTLPGDVCVGQCRDGATVRDAAGVLGAGPWLAVCMPGGEWSLDIMSVCVPLVCPPPPPPSGGDLECSGGASCTATCRSGYVLRGAKTRTCVAGQWAGVPPSCRPVDCGVMSPTPVRGGGAAARLQCSGTAFGSTCTTTCPRGTAMFTAEGVAVPEYQQQCGFDGRWGRDVVWQGRPYTLPAGPADGPAAGAEQARLGADEVEEAAVCQPLHCKRPPTPAHGTAVCDDLAHAADGTAPAPVGADGLPVPLPVGGRCTYACDEGHRATNGRDATVVECLPSALLTNPAPVCRPVECPAKPPPPAANSTVSCSGSSFADVCTYKPAAGHVFDGGADAPAVVRLVCGANGLWNGKIASAVPLECPTLSSVWKCTGNVAGDTCASQCGARPAGGAASNATGGRPCQLRCEVGGGVGRWVGGCDATQFRCPGGCREQPPKHPGAGPPRCRPAAAQGRGDAPTAAYGEGTVCRHTCAGASASAGDRVHVCSRGSWVRVDGEPIVAGGPCAGPAPDVGRPGATAALGVPPAMWPAPACGKHPMDPQHPRAVGFAHGRVACAAAAAPADDAEASEDGQVVCRFSCDAGFRLVGGSNRSECDGARTAYVYTPGVGICAPVPRRGARTAPEAMVAGPAGCGPAPPSVNAEVTCSSDAAEGVEVGGWCSYVCDEGTELVAGDAGRTCDMDGTWAGEAAVCAPAECELPNRARLAGDAGPVLPANTVARCGGTAVGSECVVACAGGYVAASGVPAWKAVCEGGVWTGPAHACAPATCDPVDEPYDQGLAPAAAAGGGFGSAGPLSAAIATAPVHVCGSGVVDDACEVKCALAPERTAHRVCLASGQWSGQRPDCGSQLCEQAMVAAPNFGWAKCSGMANGGRCTFGCEDGYRLAGSPARECDPHGRWTGAAARCEKLDCGPPPTSDHVVTTCTGTGVGAVCSHECCCSDHELAPRGYAKAVVCNKQGAWAPVIANETDDEADEDDVVVLRPPLCAPVACPAPPALADGRLVCNGTRAGDRCDVLCGGGFAMAGAAAVRCSARIGRDAATVCRRATVTFSPDLKPSTLLAQAGCLDDAAEASGEWVAVVPPADPAAPLVACAGVTCPDEEAAAAGREGLAVACDGRGAGAVCNVSCAPGWRLATAGQRVCQADSSWSGPPPRCERVACAALATDAVRVDACAGSRFGDACNFSCPAGYSLQGAGSAECGPAGEWTAPAPACGPVTCDRAQIRVSNGYVSCSGDSLGDTCVVVCNQGFEQDTDFAHPFACGGDGQWHGGSYVGEACARISCPAAPQPQGVAAECAAADGTPVPPTGVAAPQPYGTRCVMGCAEGFRPADLRAGGTGKAVMVCGAASAWAGRPPACEPASCPALAAPVNGRVECTKHEAVGSVCRFACQRGYEMVGAEATECGASSAWTEPAPPICAALASAVEAAIGRVTVAPTAGEACEATFHVAGVVDAVLSLTPANPLNGGKQDPGLVVDVFDRAGRATLVQPEEEHVDWGCTEERHDMFVTVRPAGDGQCAKSMGLRVRINLPDALELQDDGTAVSREVGACADNSDSTQAWYSFAGQAGAKYELMARARTGAPAVGARWKDAKLGLPVFVAPDRHSVVPSTQIAADDEAFAAIKVGVACPEGQSGTFYVVVDTAAAVAAGHCGVLTVSLEKLQ